MDNKFKVVLIANDNHPIPDWVGEKFSAADIEYVYHECYGREDLEKCASDANILWLVSSRKELVVEENMDIFRNLIAVFRVGSGTDNVDHDACTKRGIIIAHTPEDVTECTSNHAIAMLFAAVHRIARQDRRVRRGVWNPREAMAIGGLTGADLGIIGFGRIGQAIARKLSGFCMNLRIYDPFANEQEVKKAKGRCVELSELFTRSQYVLLCCPLTKETEKLIGPKEFEIMRKDSVLVNCARGPIVDEKALARALKEKQIGAAAIDVVENPPLQLDNELLSFEDVTVTPHAAGYPDNYPDKIFSGMVEIIIGISQGVLPKWIANKDVKPKWKYKANQENV
jgi:phosphoglycerate dehydrogenase-like enzyme